MVSVRAVIFFINSFTCEINVLFFYKIFVNCKLFVCCVTLGPEIYPCVLYITAYAFCSFAAALNMFKSIRLLFALLESQAKTNVSQLTLAEDQTSLKRRISILKFFSSAKFGILTTSPFPHFTICF